MVGSNLLELSDLHVAILSGLLFFIIVGRLTFDSFKELFVQLIALVTLNAVAFALFEEGEASSGQGKILTVVIISILFAAALYLRLHFN